MIPNGCRGCGTHWCGGPCQLGDDPRTPAFGGHPPEIALIPNGCACWHRERQAAQPLRMIKKIGANGDSAVSGRI